MKGGEAGNRSFPSSFLTEKEAQRKKKRGNERRTLKRRRRKRFPQFLKEILEKLSLNVKVYGPYLMSKEKYSQKQEKTYYVRHKSSVPKQTFNVRYFFRRAKTKIALSCNTWRIPFPVSPLFASFCFPFCPRERRRRRRRRRGDFFFSSAFKRQK